MSSSNNPSYTITFEKEPQITRNYSAGTLTLTTEPLPLQTPHQYHRNMWEIFKHFAISMHTENNVSRELPRSLYFQFVHDGRVQRGLYTIQMPRLVRIDKLTPNTPQKDMVKFHVEYDTSTTPHFITCTLLLHPSYEMRSGLYACSMSFHLSNPHWRLEDALYSGCDDCWDISKVLKNVPQDQQSSCDGHFVLNVLRYTAPLPPKRCSSWSEGPVAKFAREFKSVFFA